MKAQRLANFLLEMNILNSKDVVRELNRITARVYDPRAKQWMQRVGKYFLLNIDELMSREANLKPEINYRNPYYFDPKLGWIETERMRKPPPNPPAEEGDEWVFQIDRPSSGVPEFLGVNGRSGPIEDAAKYPYPPENADTGFPGKWVRTTELGLMRPGDVMADRMKNWNIIKHGDSYLGDFDDGRALWIAPTVENSRNQAVKMGDEEAQATLEQLRELNPGEEYTIERVRGEEDLREARANRMADFILEARDPKGKPYTTMLHTRPEWAPDSPGWGRLGNYREKPPFWQRAREQAYAPFNPKKAKAKTLPGEGPSKKEVQPWMFDPEGKPKELQLFNPWDMDQQEVWQTLHDIADWFNYVYTELKAGSKDDEAIYQNKENNSLYFTDANDWGPITSALHVEKDDIPDVEVPEGGKWVNPAAMKAKKANEYLDRLKSHARDDVDAFRDVYMDALEFKHDVQHKPTRFMKDVKTISRQGNLTIRRATTFDATCTLENRPGWARSAGKMAPASRSDPSGKDLHPDWCVNQDFHYSGYAKNGPLYFVEKEGRPYVLVHWPSNQAKDEDNVAITQAIAREIAPVFAANEREFPTDKLRQYAGSAHAFGGDSSSETGRLAKEILRVRGV